MINGHYRPCGSRDDACLCTLWENHSGDHECRMRVTKELKPGRSGVLCNHTWARRDLGKRAAP